MASLGSGCQSLQKLDRGIYRVADSVSETDQVTGRRSLSFAARSEQIAQGNSYIEKLLAAETKAGRPVDAALDKKQYLRLIRVFDRVHAVSHLRRERWQPVLLDRDSFNAFTTGGTYIVVHRGLMQQLQSDDELAAVLGHEIAHTVANHVFERQSHVQLSTLAGSRSARRGSYQSAFTHENEREADRIGILYSALAGFDPLASSRIWQRQYIKEGTGRALRFHDHPVNTERQQEAAAVGRKVAGYYRAGQQNPAYPQLLQSNVLWRQSQSAAPGEGGGVSALFDTVLGAYVQHQVAKQEERRQAAEIRRIKALETRLKQPQFKKVSERQLKASWYYQAGSPELQSVIMGLLVKRNEQVERYIAHVPGRVTAGRRFSVSFTLPVGLTVDQLQQLPLKFYLDDARQVL
ncbi:M48 family metallopeptidase [Marinobacterium jannaschii]|uniref:M48 family metallopeptidase n=1 Tax=Marinobacterium jannaschii TaxID=64970 RepID=UPI000AD25221|nr:M48 family metallopeptidase [Marinobacterium jannaschii]